MTSNDTINPDFKKWAMQLTGCDGGDLGSPEKPSIWVCGIEWGAGKGKAKSASEMRQEFENPKIHAGYVDTEEKRNEQLGYPFNQACYRILYALASRDKKDPHHNKAIKSENYAKFFKEVKPFTEGEKGYFKMNLYPLAFPGTDKKHWTTAHSQATGLRDKNHYMKWTREHRLPIFQEMSKKHQPRLILCIGFSCQKDFEAVFLENKSFQRANNADCHELQIYQGHANNGKTLVVMVEHPAYRKGKMRYPEYQEYLGWYLAAALNAAQ